MAKREQNSEANINSSCKVNHKDATLISGKRHQGHNDHYSTSNIPSRKLREHHNPTAHTPPPSQHPSQPTQPKLLTIQIRLLKPTPGSMMEQDLDKVTTILEGKSSNERPPPRKKSRLFFRLRVRGRGKKTRLQVLPFAHQVSSRRARHLLEGSPSTASGTVLAMVRYLSAYSISRYRRVSRRSRLDTYFQKPYTPVRVISLSEYSFQVYLHQNTTHHR